MGPYFRIQYIRIHRFWSRFLGHGIRKTSNARCQACQPILITDLGSNKYVSRLCRCRISWLLSESSLYSCDSNVRARYVNFSTRGNSQYIYGICLFSAEVPTPSSYHFRYYRALNSSSINYRFTSYRRCLYYNV
ncbi:Uncharacterised protein [Streptococcus pneumoniae]|nr:Uncharacterised protein [Streptococcus pneumoniae]CKF39038.1 Uncharacterised protein [Streptococcus pneumoniae]